CRWRTRAGPADDAESDRDIRLWIVIVIAYRDDQRIGQRRSRRAALIVAAYLADRGYYIGKENDVPEIVAVVVRIARECKGSAEYAVVIIGDRADISIHDRCGESKFGKWKIAPDVHRYHISRVCLHGQGRWQRLLLPSRCALPRERDDGKLRSGRRPDATRVRTRIAQRLVIADRGDL